MLLPVEDRELGSRGHLVFQEHGAQVGPTVY